MRRRGLYLLWMMALLLGVLVGAATAHGGVNMAVADGVRGVQPTQYGDQE